MRMDKLRAIQYFNRTVETGSFTAAARSLEVSTPAVTKLVAALERTLGAPLLVRARRGLTLTAEGERYYATSRRLLAEFQAFEARFNTRAQSVSGTLAVGLGPALAQYCVMPRIERFRQAFPDVELIVHSISKSKDLHAYHLDLGVLVGWPIERELVVKRLAQLRNVICASPQYWREHGTPPEPAALKNHHCLVFRSTGRTLLDQWIFERNGARSVVDVTGKLRFDDRNWVTEAACAGAGVARVGDLTSAPLLAGGQLVPVLTDWECVDAPIVFAAYRPNQRYSRLVRAFIEFLGNVFLELAAERWPAPISSVVRSSKPAWYAHAPGRDSKRGTGLS